MNTKEVIAEIEMKGGRLYLIHKRKGVETSHTDVTAVWHFLKEVELYKTPRPNPRSLER